ncbi:MAG: hypothetical protein ACRD3W_20745, partial [Terriglobales bacterium]
MQAANKAMEAGIQDMSEIQKDPTNTQLYKNEAMASFQQAQVDIDKEAIAEGGPLPEQSQLQMGDNNFGLPPGVRLSQYAGTPAGFSYNELAFDARLASHDMQGNGASEPTGPQGDIYLQTLMNGQNNGQGSTFLDNAQDAQWFLQSLTQSFNSQGQITGAHLTQSVADSYYQATGTDILPILSQQPSLSADTSAATIYKSFPDLTSPGGIQQLDQQSGMTDEQIMADALFGHAQFEAPGGQLTNSFVSQFLAGADNPATDPIDQPLINLDPGTQAAYASWLNSSNPAGALESAFLGTIGQEYGISNL